MEFGNFLEYFALGMAGALALELLKVYEYRGKLTLKKYQKLVRSPIFWGVVIGMLLASGFVAWGANAGDYNVTPWQIILSGMGARSLVRDSSQARVANRQIPLGSDESRVDKVTLNDVFA